MKTISTTKMNLTDKAQLMGDLLGVFGNENIRGHHIRFFEDKIIEYGESSFESVTQTPHYYAWLCLMTEHLFWLMRQFCFKQNELKKGNLSLDYNNIIATFCEKCREDKLFSEEELARLYEVIIKILEIRHAITHKGFPNLLPELLDTSNSRKKPKFKEKGYPVHFNEINTKKAVNWFSDPRNFSEIKKEFEILTKALSKGQAVSVGF
ncbi:MAG: hypothetical protein H8E41_05850 [Desulfobulbaceae bacterium]|uniref:Uncharacterized protein n=1 Tax=Candidatus Desulfobia pelagia TaxID=2841692 RepID=A0A8J6NED9_9BACT|nr:hypothetical protein [Candidatus Desulfobia pelagia]